MGFTVGWYRLNENGRSVAANDAPEDFWGKSGDWYGTLTDVRHERVRTCGCAGKHGSDCWSEYAVRPIDFAAFRERLNAQGLLTPDEDGDCICRDMTDWLEAHPDVYVEYR